MAGDAEGVAVGLARAWPVGADGVGLGAFEQADAEEFGEAEVVADGGTDGKPLLADGPWICHDFAAAGEEIDFLAEREGVNFVELAEEGAVGGEDGGAVSAAAVGADDGSGAVNRDSEFFGEAAQEGEGCAIGIRGGFQTE